MIPIIYFNGEFGYVPNVLGKIVPIMHYCYDPFLLIISEILVIPRLFQISEHIEGAVVYLDAGATESFQFIGAYPLLLELGARAVCSLENMTVLDSVSSSFICCQTVFLCIMQSAKCFHSLRK